MDQHCEGPSNIPALTGDHSRHWRDNRLVYPVISRRSRGMSIGVNLSPAGGCTFRCVYCQVDREHERFARARVELPVIIRELNALLDMVADGGIWNDPKFAAAPEAMRRLNDVAFSGDGEPTLCRRFADAVTIAADALRRRSLDGVKLVVITNATRLHTANFRKAIPTLQQNRGEVWCKLDAGSQQRYAAVNRSDVPLATICRNIAQLATEMPVVIQTCLLELRGEAPDDYELELYCERLAEILRGGGAIRQVQLYTLARPPAEDYVRALDSSAMTRCAETVRRRLPGLAVDIFI